MNNLVCKVVIFFLLSVGGYTLKASEGTGQTITSLIGLALSSLTYAENTFEPGLSPCEKAKQLVMEHISSINDEEIHPAYRAAVLGDFSAVKDFIHRGLSSSDVNMLVWASFGGHPEIVEYLLSCGSDPNAETTTQFLPGHSALWALASGYWWTVTMAKEMTEGPLSEVDQANTGHIKCLELLDKAGLDFDKTRPDGKNILDAARDQGLSVLVSNIKELRSRDEY